MKTTRKIIEIDDELCDGCGQCVPSCAEGALQIVNGKARIVSENLCDGLGACMGECPQGALKITEREADEFDEEAVEKYLEALREKEAEKPTLACGCPSQQIRSFAAEIPCACMGDEPAAAGAPKSALTHWPIQIRLIPPTAPFLKNADLLVLADCGAVAAADLHTRLLPGKVVMMGCPKFDDIEEYTARFREIFTKAGVRSVTVVSMEVPCCAGLAWVVKKALESTNADIPLTEIIISGQGKIVSEKKS
jgi:NAD-dependent dihydropyrimidine dehydrogenase PreA subunit